MFILVSFHFPETEQMVTAAFLTFPPQKETVSWQRSPQIQPVQAPPGPSEWRAGAADGPAAFLWGDPLSSGQAVRPPLECGIPEGQKPLQRWAFDAAQTPHTSSSPRPKMVLNRHFKRWYFVHTVRPCFPASSRWDLWGCPAWKAVSHGQMDHTWVSTLTLQMTDVCELNRRHYWGDGRQVALVVAGCFWKVSNGS